MSEFTDECWFQAEEWANARAAERSYNTRAGAQLEIDEGAKLGKLFDELEQLRNAEKAADAEIEHLRAENAVLEAKLSSFDNIEKMSIVSNKLAELDWFRRREREVLERLFRKNADDGRFATLLDWEEANPRPGGGT